MNELTEIRNYFLLSLFASHLVSDFLLQSASMASSKHKPAQLLKHLFITAATIYIITGAFNLWLLPVLFFVVHGIIDLLKLKFFKDNKLLIPFLFDQILHFITIILAALVIEHYSEQPLKDISWWANLFGNNYFFFLLLLSALILVSRFGSLFVDISVKPLLDQIEMDNSKRGFINGGKIIGMLERTLILLFVISDNFSAVGFLIAAKSIFRFGEFSNPNNRKESEYIIIGTMISFLLAIGTGLAFIYISKYVSG
ncbi:MAG: DUF3307 domain-containing protein [Melioribacter sp.]|nr:DUF3307 domain-containing protein [Melioribacter sp.]